MSRLLGYLTTKVNPPNLEYYVEHQPDTCPLCLKPNHGYTQHVFKIHEDGEVVKVLGTICERCQHEIEDAEIFEENKYWEPKKTPALETYMELHKFPEKAQAFTRIPHLCIFCREDVGDDHMELKLPCGDDMIGGKVSVCENCATILNWTPRYAAMDTCRRCKEKYPITASEYRLRSDDFMLERHFCFSCMSHHHGRDLSYEDRWKSKQCEVCECSVVQDLTCNTPEQLGNPRCPDHVNFVKAIAPEKYNLFIHYSKKYPFMRVVITDRKDFIKVSYETGAKSFAGFFEVLDTEIFLPNTVKPEDIFWKAANKLEDISEKNTHEDR